MLVDVMRSFRGLQILALLIADDTYVGTVESILVDERRLCRRAELVCLGWWEAVGIGHIVTGGVT
jgi:hypothetical protein